MALELFEFLEQIMIDTILIKITQFEKTGSIGKISVSLGNLIKGFSMTFSLSLFDN